MGDLDGNATSALGHMGAILSDGIEQFQPDDIVFTKYVRVVLPLDGFVFWVKSGLLSDTSIISVGATNDAEKFTARGAFHIGISQEQNEDSTPARNQVVFTTKTIIQNFNRVSSSELYIAEYDGIRFSFNTSGMYQRDAGLYHYVGTAVYSVMGSQIIDDVSDFDTTTEIVSNSLPLFLGMNGYEKQDWELHSNPVTLYPSFLVPTNLPPPYGVFHVGDQDTVPLTNTYLTSTSTTQLCKDKVRITLYGYRNSDAIEFVNFLQQYAANTGYLGIMNIPAIKDAKRTQTDISALAQKKLIDIEVDYYQVRVAAVTRELIQTAVPSYSAVKTAP